MSRAIIICLLLAGCSDPVQQVKVLDHLRRPSALVTRRDGVKDGSVTLFWPDGKSRSQGQYRDDRREGWWRSYHANGNLRSLTRYAHGAKDGLRIYWDSLGRPVRSETFVHGTAEGALYRFFPDGHAAQRSNFVDGLLEGTHDQWYRDEGGSRVNGFYHQGKEEGVWTEYDSSGRMVWQAYLKGGEVTRWMYGDHRWH